MSVISALWWRDMLRFRKERSRWFGVLAQPLLFWAIIGLGLNRNFAMSGPDGMSYLKFFYPGTLVMCVLFTAIFASISIIEDRQAGFLQGVLVAPAPRAAIVFGKIAGVATLALIQSVLFLVAAPAAEYPFTGINWALLALAMGLGCVGLAGLNFAMAWIINSTHGYHAVMSAVLIPAWMLSGAMFPLTESWMGKAMVINPMSYFVDAVRTALAGNAAVAVYPPWAQAAGLAGFAAVTLVVAVACVKRTGGKV